MSTNIRQTKEQALASKEQFWFRLKLVVAIALVFLFVLVASWLGIIKPVAAADLSNGAFCVKVTNDKEPDIFGMAGAKNCGEAEVPPVVTPPAPKPNLAITSCTISNNGLGMLTSASMIWTSPQAYTEISATIDGRTIPAPAITPTGPNSGTYTYMMTLSKAQLDSIMAKTGGYSATLRVDATLGKEISYGTRSLTVGANGMGSSCK